MGRGALVAAAVLCTLALAFTSHAQAQSSPRPPKLEPLPEPPPPPPMPADEPAVRIPVRPADVVEEIREAGRVIMLKVTPPGGVPYFLVDPGGTGAWMRRDSLDEGLRVPLWTIYTFD